MTVIKDGDFYRAYYRVIDEGPKGEKTDGTTAEHTCYAESKDGHEWTFPKPGIYEINGSRDNNIILSDIPPFTHNFSPFLDTNPGADRSERFKALAGTKSSGLHAFVSTDGIHWTKKGTGPVMTFGHFDSQNVSFWSEAEEQYVCYFRTFIENPGGKDLRSVSRSTSSDFLNWTEPVAMNPNLPGENLYTSQTHPYFRAPHIYIALPTRFQYGKIAGKPVSGNIGSTDILLMTSRAGSSSFDRTFLEAFIRPGLDSANWGNRANYLALNVVPVSREEMSVYHQDGHRYVMRTDGFVSLMAGYAGGEMVTKPVFFEGEELIINYSTSTAGNIRIEIQDQNGNPMKGFYLEECNDMIGDEIEGKVTWKGSPDLGMLSGKPVRLRFVMKDCDLFSFKFK
jgi:hypothetical protein